MKTNRLDSRKLSEGLRGGQLRSIHVPSPTYRELRHLVQLRDTHVRQLTATKCRIKALLLYEGIPFPEARPSNQWSARVLRELGALPCTRSGALQVGPADRDAAFPFSKSAATSKNKFAASARNDPELRQSISCFTSASGHRLDRGQRIWWPGWETGARSSNVRQIAGFLGLVSSEHSTGDKGKSRVHYPHRRQSACATS